MRSKNLIYLFHTFLFFAFHFSDSVAQNDFTKFRAFEKKVRYSNPDSFNIASEKKNKIFELEMFRFWSKGKYFYSKSEFDKAYEWFAKAKKQAIKLNDLLSAAEFSLDISNCLSILENTGKSLDELFYALNIFEKSGSKYQLAKTWISIGELYRKIGQYEKSINALMQSKKYLEKYPELLASYYNRRAAVKSETSQMDSAYYFSKKALNVALEIGDKSLQGVSENEIGYILKHKGKKDSAVFHFKKAEKLFQECGMTAYALQAAGHYSIIISENGDNNEAIRVLFPGYMIAKKNNWYRLKRDYSEYLRNSYLALNKKDSFHHYEIERLEATIQLMSSQNEMNERLVETMYEEQKFNEQIIQTNELLKDAQFHREKAESEKRFMILIITLSLLVLILLLFMIRFQMKRKRLILNEKIEKEKQNAELQELLKNNEALVQEISHRVKNNLSVLSGLLGIQKSRSGNIEVKKELEETIFRIDSISAIHNQFYDSKETGQIHLQNAFYKLSYNIAHAMGYSPEKIIKLELDDIVLDIERSVNLSMILNEILTNSFKYAVKKIDDEIKISLKKENDFIILAVKDCGMGFTIGENQNLQSSKSMGMYLIDLLCRQIKAEKDFFKSEDGFTVKIKFSI